MVVAVHDRQRMTNKPDTVRMNPSMARVWARAAGEASAGSKTYAFPLKPGVTTKRALAIRRRAFSVAIECAPEDPISSSA